MSLFVRNTSLFDAWTLAHIATGVLAARLGVPHGLFLGLTVAYEAVEYSTTFPIGKKVFGAKRPESSLNVAGDLIASTGAYLLVRRYM